MSAHSAIDTLAKVAVKASLSPRALRAVRSWLGEQLVAHEYAKLGQGGHKNVQVPLRQVFVDLPVVDSLGDVSEHYPRELFLSHLISAAPLEFGQALAPGDVVSPSSSNVDGDDVATEQRISQNLRRHHSTQGWSATLLIGGPGQGKSTLGQLACQLHRAALLNASRDELTTAQRDLVDSLVNVEPDKSNDNNSQSLKPPKNPFFPLQIALPDLAAWLNKQQAISADDQSPILLRFLAELPSAKTFGLNVEDLLQVVRYMPTLLVLDGFDEVGSTLDRERIVTSARGFLSFVSRHSGACQVVATTRPQGYADELSQIGIRFQIRYLAPLTRDEALEYAQKLVGAKIEGADQRETMLRRLYEAAAEPATERLLTTPLQVTILTALVQQLGRAPRERWNLFSRYFAYSYDREIERESYASALLAEHRSHIEKIHARVALLLQVEAERAGGASARMARVRLEEVIDAVLAEDEISASKRASLVRDIAVAAELRLVFLVEPEPGSFGFEIRSLQEFMAAWALTSGRDTEIEARLQQVSKAPMFRNVLLFMASRFFSEGSPLRDVLADRICGFLDEDVHDELARTTRAGGILALETLEEGAVLSQPKRARSLMLRATGLFALPPLPDHVRLARTANADTAPVLAEAIERILIAPRDEHSASRLAVWVCLIEASNRGEGWAIEIGRKYWPPEADLAELLDNLERLRLPIGRWISKEIEGAARLISPESFIDIPTLLSVADAHENWTAWLTHVRTVLGRHGRTLLRGVVNGIARPGRARFALQPSYPPPDMWKAWVSVLEFEVNPGASTLAKALSEVADEIPVSLWRIMQWRASWPLASCLLAADSPADLRRFADQLSSGQLGDTEAWHRAEDAWKGSIDSAFVFGGLIAGLPWDVEAIKRAPPFLAVPSWLFNEKSFAKTPQSLFFENAMRVFKATNSNSVKVQIAEGCLFAIRNGKRKLPVSEEEFRGLLFVAPRFIGLVVPRPKSVSLATWSGLLDSIAVETITPWFSSFREGLMALDTHPNHPVLLRLLMSVFELHARHLSSEELLPPKDRKEGIRILSVQRPNSMDSQAAISILGIFMGTTPPDQDAVFFDHIAKAARERPRFWKALLGALRVGHIAQSRTNWFLLRTYSSIGGAHSSSYDVIDQLRNSLQNRRSDLDNGGTWDRLALPLPYPKPTNSTVYAGGIPSNPIWISSIEVRDIGGLHHLKIPLSPPTEETGQWVVFLGPNGVGKTTLLRSIVLALRNTNDPTIWPKGSFANSWHRECDSDEERVVEATIVVGLGTEAEHKTLIRQGESLTISQFPQQAMPRLFPIFAYGCRRGSALGGAARQVDLSDDDGPEIATLFDEGADLIHAETWLLQLDGDAQKSARSRTIFEAVIGAVATLLDLETLQIRDRKVWVTERARPKLPFSALSDGYLTSAGWFLDLIARWLTYAERYNYPISPGFLAEMKGLVLVDEIDLHLHPRWQIEIIGRTRRLLPKMSFVVTTHNPLTLVGAKADEIWILSRQVGKVSAVCGVDTPMLLTGGQLYTRYFDIEDIYPDGLGRALQRYGFLSGYRMRNDLEQAELEELQDRLRLAGIDPSWPVEPRELIQPEGKQSSMTNLRGSAKRKGHK